MGVTIRDDRKGWDRMVKQLRRSRRRHVVAGITNESGGGAVNGTASVLEYANHNEFGAVTKKGVVIPSRPFMRHYYDTNLKKIGDFAERSFLKLITGQTVDVDQAFNEIGLFLQNGIKATIRNADKWAVPNAPSTVYNKLMKNRGAVSKYIGAKIYDSSELHQVAKQLAPTGPSGTKPLIDHGIMINSVTFDIRTG